MYRFRSSSAKLNLPHIKKKALNSWTAVQDTYFSTKDTFERHKVVFTVSTSVASVATAWLGYTLRHMHEKKVEQRLNSIENAMKSNFDMEHSEFKKLVGTSGSTTAAYIATAGTSLILGYGLGWRGGRWFANRKFRREQMKLLGQIKPRRWPLKFLRRPSLRFKADSSVKASEQQPNDVPNTHAPTKPHPIC